MPRRSRTNGPESLSGGVNTTSNDGSEGQGVQKLDEKPAEHSKTFVDLNRPPVDQTRGDIRTLLLVSVILTLGGVGGLLS